MNANKPLRTVCMWIAIYCSVCCDASPYAYRLSMAGGMCKNDPLHIDQQAFFDNRTDPVSSHIPFAEDCKVLAADEGD